MVPQLFIENIKTIYEQVYDQGLKVNAKEM